MKGWVLGWICEEVGEEMGGSREGVGVEMGGSWGRKRFSEGKAYTDTKKDVLLLRRMKAQG